MNAPLLSIVIPCKNEEDNIHRTLSSLEHQNFNMRGVSVFIADAESTDHTREIIHTFKKKSVMDIRIIKGGYPPEGRNLGAERCQSKYILFMDADIELGESSAISKSVSLAERKQLDLVSTFIKCRDGNIYDNIFWERMHGFTYRYPHIVGPYAAGMFILIRREKYKDLGGFNESMILGDDWELTHKIKRDKFAVADTFIFTTNRRFKTSGYLKTIGQYFLVAMSREYRKKGHREYMHVDF